MILEFLKGWQCDIAGTSSFDDLPDEAIKYVKRIEELVKVPVRYISVGPKRGEIIEI